MNEFLKRVYIGGSPPCTYFGLRFECKRTCETYLAERVGPKLGDSEPTRHLQLYLEELASTGFFVKGLQAQVADPPKPKDWEIGEVIAEVVLEDVFEAHFPWPTSLDKRTPRASLPGPDLVGFTAGKTFAFGEVKSSGEQAIPPQVVKKSEDGLLCQLKKLLVSEEAREQLIAWLLVKARESEWELHYQESLSSYFGDSPGKAQVFGVLVSGDRAFDKKDLEGVHDALSDSCDELRLTLISVYLPLKKNEWCSAVRGQSQC